MKRLLSLLLLLANFSAIAQFTENFGKIDTEEIDIKICSFDSAAGAATLLHEASTYYDDSYHMITYHHVRRKILQKSGLEYANISIRYYSGDDFEYIDDIKAMTINISQNSQRVEVPVDKKSFYYKKINAYYSEVSFAFPQAGPGSILEYTYRSTMKHYGGLEEWNFQTELPVYKSSYFLKPPPNLEFTYAVQKTDNYPIKIEPSEREGTIYYEMKNIPGLDAEPYMDSREDYLQKVRFQITKIAGYGGARQYMSSWNEVARELSTEEDFGKQLKVNLPDEQKAFVVSLTGRSDKEKMTAIYDYIRRNYQWNHFHSRSAGEGLRSLYTKKTGTSGAINFALINMLQEAKLEVYPLLVSERGNGAINTRSPFVQQFNSAFAAVFIDGKPYYLDATDPVTPAHLIPESILNTTALLLKKNTGILTSIQEDQHKYQNTIFINSTLEDNGALTGTVQQARKDYARTEGMRYYSADSRKNIDFLKKGFANIDIDSLDIKNVDTDTLALAEHFQYKTGVQHTAEYAFLNISMFTGFEANPFISNKRFSNVNFGSKRSVTLTHIMHLPQGIVIDAVPKNLRLINGDRSVSFTRELAVYPEISMIQARITINLEKSLYSVEEYPELKEFFKKMTDLLNEQIVIKKKL